MECEGVTNKTQLVQDGVQWRTFVNTVVNPRMMTYGLPELFK